MHRKDFLLWGSQAALLTAFGVPEVMASTHRSPHPSPNEAQEPLATEIESLIPKLMQGAKVPGFSIAVVRNGQLSWSKGFGVKDIKSKEPVNSETIFEAASVSKTVFAYAVMKLCEKGKIGLDVPLVKYTSKQFLKGDPRLDLITARYVLSHRSGFQNWRGVDDPLKIHFTPGTDFLYSGEGYFYLQSILTELMGKTDPNACGTFEAGLKLCATDIGDYLEQNILRPFGMNASGYVWSAAIGKNQALSHDLDGNMLPKPHPTATDMARYASAGGLLTNVNDYARFVIGVFSPKENDPFRLNKKSLMEMVSPQVKLREDQKIDGASSWALGWAVQERPTGNVILHSGGQPGFRSLAMASLEKKTAFVMLSNSDGGGHVLYNQDLGNVLNRLFA
jgi:CubicO group peptidase (beta-lactamase class C family)